MNTNKNIVIKTDDNDWSCKHTITGGNYNTSHVFEILCHLPASLDKKKSYTWYPQFEDPNYANVDSKIKAIFYFRSKPYAPYIISCGDSSTPTVKWNSNITESDKDRYPDTYRIWAHSEDGSSAVLLGTTNYNKDEQKHEFKTPIDKQLPEGEWKCVVEAVQGNSTISSFSDPIAFTVPKVPTDAEDIEFSLDKKESFTTKNPELTGTITWNDDDSKSDTRRLILIYGPGSVSGSVNDKRKEVAIEGDGSSFTYGFKEELESQTYHWRVVGKNGKGKITYSSVETFTVTAGTGIKEVTAIEPAEGAFVPYINNTSPEITLRWLGNGWGSHSGDDSSLEYTVTCECDTADCTVEPTTSITSDPFVKVKINKPSDKAKITWTVKASNGESATQEKKFIFNLCEKPSLLSVPYFNNTISGEISTPELEIGYTPLKTCTDETEDQLDKIRIVFTPAGSTGGEPRVYEVSPDTVLFKVPENLPSGPWTAALVAVAPGYPPAVSEKNMSFTSCRSGPLPRPNITKFVSDINDKHVYIDFTISTWPKDKNYCRSSNTLSEIVIQTAYNNTVTQDTISINATCSKKDGANGVTTYECSHTFVYDVLGTTYIALVAKNPAGASSYSDPHPAAMRYYTDLEGSTTVTLFEPEDNGCVSKDEAVLTWDPLSLGIIGKESELNGVGYTVYFGTNGTFKPYNTTKSSLDVSGMVSIGGHYSWYVVPKEHNGDSSTMRTFAVRDDQNPIISTDDWAPSAVPPFTISWNTTWNKGCGRKSHLILADGNVVGVVGETTSYTFQKGSIMFEDGKNVEISIVARQGDLSSDKVTKSVTLFKELNPPTLTEPKDGEVVDATNIMVFSWSALPQVSGVTYNFYLKSPTKDIAESVLGTTYELLLDDIESGVYNWSVSTVLFGRESQLAPYKSLTLNVIGSFGDSIALYWPPDGATVPKNIPIEFSWSESRFGNVSEPNEDEYVLYIYDTDESNNMQFKVPPSQTSVTVPLDAGEYTWAVGKINGDSDISLTENFTINVVNYTTPAVPSKSNDPVCSYSQTLKWTGLSNEEWGGVNCNGIGDKSHFPERACSYVVYVGTSADSMHFVGRTRDTSYTLQEGVAIRGNYYWTVVADNGFTTSYNESMEDTSTFNAYTLMPPMPIYPIVGDGSKKDMPLTFNVSFVALDQTDGDLDTQGCGPTALEQDTYTLSMTYMYSIGNFSENFTEFEVDSETGISYKTFKVYKGSSSCDLSVTNKFGLSSVPKNNEGSLSFCDEIPTVAPVLNDPMKVDDTIRIATALVDDGKRGKKLTWHHYKDEYFGNVCPVVTITMLRLYFWTDTHPKASRVIDTKTEDFILVPFKDMFDKLGAERFSRNTTFYFQLVATNSNRKSAESEVVTLRTMMEDCESTGCNNGDCDEETLVCTCFEGYTGVDCSQESKKGGISDGLKYGLVGLGIFLFLVIVAIVIIAVHYYSKHKKDTLRPPPNFEELRVPPIKRPNYIQNLNGSPDEKLMEKALLDENSFPLVWAIFRAAGVTEADRLSKALLYFYQKQGRGLEFILFLVNREISETTDASVLFRANSPATRAFKFYSKMVGLPYLFKTFAVMLQSIIRDINDAEEDLKEQKKLDEENSAGVTLGEIDPENIDSRVGDENINVLTLQLLCQKFLLQIVRSDKNCPGELKHVCAFIKSQLENKFPQAIYKGVGAFIFLRFYNTAITVPESYGLMESKKKKEIVIFLFGIFTFLYFF